MRSACFGLVSVAASMVGGCVSGPPSAWDVVFEDASVRARTVVIEASISEGTCAEAGRVVHGPDIFDASASGRMPAGLPRARFAMRVRARDTTCQVIGAGCTDVDLASHGSAPIVTVVRELPSPEPICEASACVGGRCDAPTDAGGPDSRTLEAGTDARDMDAPALPDAGHDASFDAAPDAYVGCEAAGVIFCDDFEDPALSRWMFPSDCRAPDAVERSTLVRRSGNGALEAHTRYGDACAATMSSPSLVLPDEDVQLRMWVRVNAPARGGGLDHTVLVIDDDIGRSGLHYNLGFTDRTTEEGVFLAAWNGTMLRGSTGGPVSIATNTWTCVRVSIPRTGAIAVSVGADGPFTLVPGAPPIPGPLALHLGIVGAGPGAPGATIYVDDLVVAAAGAALSCD